MEQLLLELAALFENTGKGERGGNGDKTQPSTQDAHAGGCGRVFSVVFLWPLVPPQICGVGTLERGGAFKEVIKVDEVIRVGS